MTERRQTVLIVDDVVMNIDVLLAVLADDYTVQVAMDGESALSAARKNHPDLVLLDVMMPGMDGFEVCRRLRADEATRGIRVIFLTALSDETDEVDGLALGAVDYVTKPFIPALVKARVRNHLELKRYEDDLEMLVQMRTRELSDAHDRLKALDAAKHDYLHAIAHELRTPATGVLGVAEMALSEMSDLDTRAEYMEIYQWSSRRLLEALDSALRLAELQAGDTVIDVGPVDLGSVVVQTMAFLREEFSTRGLSSSLSEVRPAAVLGNVELVHQSITTLFRVASRMATHGTNISIAFDESAAGVRMEVTYQAAPMEQTLRTTFFDTFSYERAGSLVQELGLAVPLAAHVVRAMGGSVDIRSSNSGNAIELVFPAMVY